VSKRICRSKKSAGWLSCLLLLSISPCYSDAAENIQETPENKQNVEQLLQSLTLENALKLAEISGSPEMDIAESEILESTAELATVKSKYGVRIKAEAVPRYVYAIDASKGDDINDSYYFLSTSKVLSDFGRTATLSEAAEADVRAEAIDFVSFRFQRRLKIIKAYLDVLLSDKRYAVDNENMVIKFLKYDKSRERQELGEVADVDLLELESAYRSELINRMRSSNRQSESRAELAVLLNRPDQLPGELQPLRVDVSDIDLLEYDALLQKVLTLNPQLAAQHERVKAAQSRLEHSRMSSRPVLDSAVELGNYERRYGEGGKWRVGVNLTIPFREGGRFKAEIAKRQAELKGEQARYQLMKNTLRKQVLELVQELEVLKLAQESAKVRLEYHDQHMDRSRARYELELQTDLGNAAAGMTEAQWDADRLKYNLLLTLGNIDALLGIDPAKRFLELN